MKRVRFLSIALSALLAICAVGLSYADELPVIKVGHVGHDHQIALYVAAQEGRALEKDYGVYLNELKPQEAYDLFDGGILMGRIILVRVGGGSKMPAALEQGHIEVGLGGLGPVAKFVDKGAKLKVLAPLNNGGDALVLGKDFPANSWEEFIARVKASDKPVKVGYKDPMAVAYMILTRALTEEGVTFGQEPAGPDGKPVQLITVNMQGLDNALPSLETGIVDGVVVNEPMGSILEHKGVGRIVADLSTVPPTGKWKGHPCCVVAVREDALLEKREFIKSLLKVIATGGDLIARDIGKALEAEAAWTKTDPEVGKKSVRNVEYVVAPDAEWLRGVDTWIELMTTSGHFQKDLKGKSTSQIRSAVLELGPMNEVLSEMKLYGRGGGK